MAEPAAAPLDAALAPAPAPAAVAVEDQQAQRFSLGAAAFGGVPDATCAQPQDQAPLAWQRLLVKHADPPALRGLLTSCRGGRDLVLQHADQATLTLPLLLDQSYEQWIAQHGLIKSALSTRGRLPTRLRIDGWDGRGQMAGTPLSMGLLALLAGLPCVSEGISNTVYHTNRLQHPQPSTATQLIAALPSLTRLEILSQEPVSLPPPSQLPKLRELCTGANVNCATLAPHMPHLIHLHFSRFTQGHPQWAMLFSAATTAQHLTTLINPQVALTDQLLGLLVAHAPVLTRLTVDSVQLHTAEHRQKSWGVNSLTVGLAPWSMEQGIAHLPACREGLLTWRRIRGGVFAMPCRSAQGLDPELVERLQGWHFDVECVRLCPYAPLPRSDQPSAVCSALRQLDTHLNAPTPIIEIAGSFRMTPDLIHAVATALPAQSRLRLRVDVSSLSAEAVSQVRQMGLRVVSVSGAYKGEWVDDKTAWPWGSILLSEVTFKGLVGLLTMLDDGVQRTIRTDKLSLEEGVTQAAIDGISAAMSGVVWARETARSCFWACLRSSEHTPVATLTAQLSLLCSMKFDWGTEQPRASYRNWSCVTLFKLTMTHDIMAALASLPEWTGRLSFDGCTWPLPAAEYRRLAQYVPTTFEEWNNLDCDDAILDSICMGANERRARLGAQPLTVYARVEKIRRVGEHVVLRHG